MRHPHSTAPAAQSNTEVQLFTWGGFACLSEQNCNNKKKTQAVMTFCLQRSNIARFYALQDFANGSRAQK